MSERRAVCVHGHFYQPPREDPVTGEVPQEPSARPYHDWNERIAAECYEPMARARAQGPDGGERVVNNYERMSFDFGPTLLLWMARRKPELLARIAAAEHAARERSGGHGAALAHPFHHVILPLATPRDRRTEILWGLAAHRRFFGAEPEGVWLPECAVDRATLADALDLGLRFTILAPEQGEGEVDPLLPATVRLEDGRPFDVVLFEGETSRGVSFGDLAADADLWFARCRERLSGCEGSSFLLVATDGETFGHHRTFAEMGLARFLLLAEAAEGIDPMLPASFLAEVPLRRGIRLREPSSWSCAHGVERWRSGCSCGITGGDHSWRAPLRRALEHLRDRIDTAWEERAGELFRDPWRARDGAAPLFLAVGPEDRTAVRSFFAEQLREGADERAAAGLLEIQLHRLSMFTSCGWFFDDIGGLEARQNLARAARAIDLSRERLGIDPEPSFLDILSEAKSNDPALGDGRRIYLEHVRPALGRT